MSKDEFVDIRNGWGIAFLGNNEKYYSLGHRHPYGDNEGPNMWYFVLQHEDDKYKCSYCGRAAPKELVGLLMLHRWDR